MKDVVGPKGSVSIVSSIDESSDIASHSLAESLRVHPNGLGVEDKIISIEDTPDHDGLCLRQVRLRSTTYIQIGTLRPHCISLAASGLTCVPVHL